MESLSFAKYLALGLHVLFFTGLFISILLMVCYGFLTLKNMRYLDRPSFIFAGPLVLLLSNNFNEKGLRYRKALFLWSLLAACFFISLVVFDPHWIMGQNSF